MPEQVKHPSPDELTRFGLGQLPHDAATLIEKHISECEPCCETVVDLAADDTFVGLLQKARKSATDQTVAPHGEVGGVSSHEIPAPLAQHPRYEIVSLIGKGGMGDVYKAQHRKMERTVALKVINRELFRKTEAVNRFHREVKTAAQLSHRNIVTSHDADQAGDYHFMVMEYVDGVDMAQIVRERGALPISDACDFVRQAALGLQHAHERGMVHRDVKPHNLMLSTDGEVKILDFGLASLAPETISDADTAEVRSDLTTAGSIMGTPDFISPEQADDARQADIRSDIYSLGATLYFLLSGRVPFVDGSVMSKLKSHAQAEPEPLDTLRGDVPAELSAIVAKMMAKEPDRRYQTPAEVAEALEALTRDPQPSAEPLPERQVQSSRNRSNWLPMTALATVLMAAIAAGIVYYIQTDKGVVQIEVEDPRLEVILNGRTIRVGDGNKEPIEIAVGEQKLVIRMKDSDVELVTDSFSIQRHDKIVFRVERRAGVVLVDKNGEQFAAKWPAQWRTASSEGRLLGREPMRWDLEHAQAGQVDGKVLHKRTKQGIPDATVRVFATTTKQLVAKTETDEEGHYQFPSLEPGEYELSVEHNRFWVEGVQSWNPKLVKEGGSRFDFSGSPVTLTEITVKMPDGTPAQSKKASLGGIGPETIIIEYFRTEFGADSENNDYCNSWSLKALPAKDLLREGSYVARAVFPHENLISNIVAFEVKGDQPIKVDFQLHVAEKGTLSNTVLGSPKESPNEMDSTEVPGLTDRIRIESYGKISTEAAKAAASKGDLSRAREILRIVPGTGSWQYPGYGEKIAADSDAAVALKLAELLVELDKPEQAADAYIEAYQQDLRLISMKHIEVFHKANRLPELADSFTDTQLKHVGYSNASYLFSLLDALASQETTNVKSIEFLKRLWTNPVEQRLTRLMLLQSKLIKSEAPEPLFFLRSLLLPQHGPGWECLTFHDDYDRNRTLEHVKPLLRDKAVVRQFADEVHTTVEKHPEIYAGVAVLSFLEAELGNYDRAGNLLEQMFENSKTSAIPYDAAAILGRALRGKDAVLDRQVIRLFEQSVANYPQDELLRQSPLVELAQFYGGTDRKSEARNLLLRLKRTKYPYCGIGLTARANYSCTHCHRQEQSIDDYNLLSEQLTNLGYPVDALFALARIDASYGNALTSSDAWAETNALPNLDLSFYAREKERFLEVKAFAEAVVTPRAVVEAIEEGRFAGKVKDQPIDLMLSVRGENGKSKLFSPVIDVLARVSTSPKADDQKEIAKLDERLVALAEQHPTNIESHIIATSFAFLRSDFSTAEKRLQQLAKVPLENESSLSEVALWLVAQPALSDDRTKAVGERLKQRALEAAKKQSDPLWKEAIALELQNKAEGGSHENGDVETNRSIVRPLFTVATPEGIDLKNADIRISDDQSLVLVGKHLLTIDDKQQTAKALPVDGWTGMRFVPGQRLIVTKTWDEAVIRNPDRPLHDAPRVPHAMVEGDWIDPVVSPDGKILATRPTLDHVQFHEMERLRSLGEPIALEADVSRMHFTQDSKYLCVHTEQGLSLWSPRTGERIAGPFRDGPYIHGLMGKTAFDPLQGRVVTVENFGHDTDTDMGSRIVVRPAKTEQAGARNFEVPAHTTCVLWADPNHLIVSGGRHKKPKDLDGYRYGSYPLFLIRLDDESSEPLELANHIWYYPVLTPNGKHVIGATNSETLCWQIGEDQPLWRTRGRAKVIQATNDYVLLHGFNATAQALSVKTGAMLQKWDGVSKTHIQQDRMWLFSEKQIEVYNVDAANKNVLKAAQPDAFQATAVPGLRRLELPSPVNSNAAKHPTGEAFQEKRQVPTQGKTAFKGVQRYHANVQLSKDGKTALVQSGAVLQMWNLETGRSVSISEWGGAGGVVGFVGQQNLAWHATTCVEFWNVNNHEKTGLVIPHSPGPAESDTISPAISHNGKLLAARVSAEKFRLWNLETQKPLSPEIEAGTAINTLEFSTDGKWLFSKDKSGWSVWDVSNQNRVAGPLANQSDGYAEIAVSPDSSKLAVVEDEAAKNEIVIRVTDGKSWKEDKRIPLPNPVIQVKWIDAGHLAVIGKLQQAMYQLDVVSVEGAQVQNYGNLRTFDKITIAPDREHFIVSNYATVTCWKLGRKAHLWKIGTSEAGRSHEVHFGTDWVLLHEKGQTTGARPAIVRSLDNGNELFRKENVIATTTNGSSVCFVDVTGIEVWQENRAH